MCRIHDGKNGVARAHGSCYIHEVQIIPQKGINIPIFPFNLFLCIFHHYYTQGNMRLKVHPVQFSHMKGQIFHTEADFLTLLSLQECL